MIQKFTTPGKLHIHFDYFPAEELESIPENVQHDIYRMVQELLNNIVKHANAANVEIALSKQQNYLYLLIEDNGKGFDLKINKKGIGLRNIESRVNMLKGELTIDSKAGRGTAFNITIPLSNNNASA